jgi:hypothetical protein
MTAAPIAWDYKQLLAALGIAVILQSLFLPCLCQIGLAKVDFAYILDALVLLRIGGAYIRHETGSGWRFYAGLLVTSPLWIQAAAWVVFGEI